MEIRNKFTVASFNGVTLIFGLDQGWFLHSSKYVTQSYQGLTGNLMPFHTKIQNQNEFPMQRTI